MSKVTKPRAIYKIDPFIFKDDLSAQDIINELDLAYPIKLKNNKDLVERVCARYKLIPKSDVIFIILNAFQSIRDLLLMGKILNLHGILYGFKLYPFKKKYLDKKFYGIRAYIATPGEIKNG